MKIYLAGLRQGTGSKNTENGVLARDVAQAYPYQLESYHYINSDREAPEYYREVKKSIFMDSGAFSMFTKGVSIPLSQYADYLKANADWIHVGSNLDVIGRGKEQESYDNQKTLEGFGARVCPVHHARDADKWLLRYMAEGYDYIFLGGMVPETKGYLLGWLDHIWEKCLTRKDGSAKIKVHGFGLTTLDLVERYPWHSVDSTRWMWLGRYGQVFVDMPDGRDIMVHISSQSPRLHKYDAHFDTLSPPNRRLIEDRFVGDGYDPEQLRTMYGLRDRWNIEFFRRICEREPRPFKRRQVGLLVD